VTGYIAGVVKTFESLIWLSERPVWNFLSCLLLLIPHTCLPAAAVYPLFLYLCLQFLISVLIFAFCFSLFPDYCVSPDIHFFFFCNLKDPIISLATSSRTMLCLLNIVNCCTSVQMKMYASICEWTWRSFNVIRNGTMWLTISHFPLVVCSNNVSILHCFRHYHLYLWP